MISKVSSLASELLLRHCKAQRREKENNTLPTRVSIKSSCAGVSEIKLVEKEVQSLEQQIALPLPCFTFFFFFLILRSWSWFVPCVLRANISPLPPVACSNEPTKSTLPYFNWWCWTPGAIVCDHGRSGTSWNSSYDFQVVQEKEHNKSPADQGSARLFLCSNTSDSEVLYPTF